MASWINILTCALIVIWFSRSTPCNFCRRPSRSRSAILFVSKQGISTTERTSLSLPPSNLWSPILLQHWRTTQKTSVSTVVTCFLARMIGARTMPPNPDWFYRIVAATAELSEVRVAIDTVDRRETLQWWWSAYQHSDALVPEWFHSFWKRKQRWTLQSFSTIWALNYFLKRPSVPQIPRPSITSRVSRKGIISGIGNLEEQNVLWFSSLSLSLVHLHLSLIKRHT